MESILSLGVVGLIAVCIGLPGMVLAIIFIIIVVRRKLTAASNRRDILLTGVTEPAVIVSASNMYSSGGGKNRPANTAHVKFDVEIQPVGQSAFRATFNDVLPIRDRDPFFPGERKDLAGVKIWVTYDHNDKSKMVLDHFDSNHDKAMKRKEFDKLEKRNAGIRRTGIEALAKIIETEDLELTNAVERDHMKVKSMRLVLDVKPQNAPSYRAETMGMIAAASLHKYSVGKKVYIKYDPNDVMQVDLIRSAEEN